MSGLPVSLTVLITFFSVETFAIPTVDPDIGLNTIELAKRYQYPIESHFIVTEDGYILNAHRIPHGRFKKRTEEGNAAVLIMHGLLGRSEGFVGIGPDKSLAFVLADAGLDVWLGNARGNPWSRNHTSFDPDVDGRKFWNFSWHEIGYYDNPAIIDYILKLKGHDSLYYIGHSQGATGFGVTASTRPEYNKKIKLAMLLAPALEYRNSQAGNLVNQILPFVSQIENLTNVLNIYEVPFLKLLRGFLAQFCSQPANYHLCADLVFSYLGYADFPQLNKTKLSVMLSTQPCGASLKQLYHYAQVIKSGVLSQYDYGTARNLIIYGTERPPSYNLSQITAPVGIYYGKNDALVNYKDAELLADLLPNVVHKYLVPHDLFNHIDFIWAIDVVPLLYEVLLKDIGNTSN